VPAALLQHRARPADLLRPGLPVGPSRPSLTFGMEEEAAVHPATGAVHLPVPDVRHRNRKPSDVRHPTHPARPPRSMPVSRGDVHRRTASNLVQGNRRARPSTEYPDRLRHASCRAVPRDGERPRPIVSTPGTPRLSTGGTTTVPAPPTRQGADGRTPPRPGPARRTVTCSGDDRCRMVIRRRKQRGWPRTQKIEASVEMWTSPT